jgi:hypothetical protein
MAMNPNAKPFTPAVKKPDIQKSMRYMGKDADFQDIKKLFQSLAWPPEVKIVFVTNGWHQGFEPARGGFVTYCGYAVNYDNESLKQHFYK